MNIQFMYAKNIVLTFMVFAFLGCQTKQEVVNYERPNPVRVSCEAPDTFLIDDAFADSRQTLSNPTCFPEFESHFQALLETAREDPKPSNRELFHDYFLWARDTGIISAMMARNYWRAYFTSNFTSLPDEYAVCHHCSRKQEIFNRMQDELAQKKQGYMAVRDPRGLGLNPAESNYYNQALSSYESIQLVFTAACQACLSD